MGDFILLFILSAFVVGVGYTIRALWRKFTTAGRKSVEEENKQHEAFQKQWSKDMEKIRSKQSKIICKLCGQKGGVTSRSHVKKEESREKGVIGATIGRKTVTKRNVQKYSCSNCGESWTTG